MSSRGDTGAPAWLDAGALDADADLYEGWLAAGKALRYPASAAALKRRAREAIGALVARQGYWQVTDRCDAEARRALEILDHLNGDAQAGEEEQDVHMVFELALLRDDLESVAMSMGSALVFALDADAEQREQVDLVARQAADLCQAVDLQAAPSVDHLLQIRRQAGGEPPLELYELLSLTSANPWWLELADPVLVTPLPARQPIVDERLVASASAVELARVSLECRVTLVVTRTTKNQIEIRVKDPRGVLAATAPELVWDSVDGETHLALTPYTRGMFRLVCRQSDVESLLQATLVLVRQGGLVLCMEDEG